WRRKMTAVMILRDSVIENELEYQEGFLLCPLSSLEIIYNGCGPDWMPDFIRDELSGYLEFFEPAFLIHDYDFNYSDKTRKSFNAANRRLYDNCKKLTANNYNWWFEPLSKARRYLQAKVIYRACQNFGWSAWID
ncbi:MAG: hypothetical protein PHV59_11700, partial [Victivallales bacterium]|nr:hypothetical protein [Victivallales bacterium]